MKHYRIKRKPTGHIELNPAADKINNKLLLSIAVHEWSHATTKISTIELDLLRTKELFDYLSNYLQENENALKQLQNKKIKNLIVLSTVYDTARLTGLLTSDLLKTLSALGIPIVSMLAGDLQIPASEVTDLVEATPLPFQLFKKHYEICRYYLQEEY